MGKTALMIREEEYRNGTLPFWQLTRQEFIKFIYWGFPGMPCNPETDIVVDDQVRRDCKEGWMAVVDYLRLSFLKSAVEIGAKIPDEIKAEYPFIQLWIDRRKERPSKYGC